MKSNPGRFAAQRSGFGRLGQALAAAALLVVLAPASSLSQAAGEPAGAGASQPQAATGSEARKAEIRRLLELLRAENMAQQMLQQLFELGIKPNLTAGLRTAARNAGRPVDEQLIEKVADVFLEKLLARMDARSFMESMIPIYERYFTEQEIKATIEFYETPAGQHFIEVQPQLLREGGEAGQRWVEQRVSPFIPQIVQETLSELPELQGP